MGKITREVKTVFLPDIHVPYHSKYAVYQALDFIDEVQPERTVILGDFVDCYGVSRYDKKPGHPSLVDEMKVGRKLLKRIKAAGGGVEVVLLEGNHERRVELYIQQNAKGLVGIEGLTVPSLLGLEELDIDWVPFAGEFSVDGYRAEHGDCTGPKSGTTAMKMLEKRGCSGVSAHSHRLGHVFHTNYSHSLEWAELGCLVDFKAIGMAYAGVGPNWQWGLGYTTGDDSLHILEVKKGGKNGS